MKIQSISMQSSDKPVADADAKVVILKISGPVDHSDEILQRARQMVVETGSSSMIESFDWALQSGAVLANK